MAFDAPTQSPLTITLDSPQTVGTLQLSNSAGAGTGYTLSGGGSNTLTFNNSSSGATIVLAGGTHVIAAPVVLADNLVVTGSGTLDFNSASSITETNGSYSLTMSGAGGKLILSGSDTYAGAMAVTGGTLLVTTRTALPSGTALIVGAGGVFIFDPLTQWATAVSGSWSSTGNWTGGAPDSAGAVAAFNAPTTTPLTITLDSSQTVGRCNSATPPASAQATRLVAAVQTL